MTADNVIGIFTSRAMKERGRYQIQFMKTRSSSGVGQKVDLEFNVDTLRITDLGEDGDTASFSQGGGQGNTSGGSSMIQGLKRTSTVTTSSSDSGGWERPTPKEGWSLEKPVKKASGTAGDIRNMLANLNSEKD
jgi:hypothetical protein